MGTALVILAVLAAAYWALKPSGKKEALDKQNLQLLNQRSAKLPEVFCLLMKEEYPDHSQSITESRVAQLIDIHAGFWKSAEGKALYKDSPSALNMEASDFKTEESRKQYIAIVADRLGAN